MPLIHRFAAAVLAVATLPAFGAPQHVTLTVPTMDCATCPVTIKVALLKVPGVSKAVVSYKHRTADVVFDDAKTSIAALTRSTDGVGYPSFQADAK